MKAAHTYVRVGHFALFRSRRCLLRVEETRASRYYETWPYIIPIFHYACMPWRTQNSSCNRVKCAYQIMSIVQSAGRNMFNFPQTVETRESTIGSDWTEKWLTHNKNNAYWDQCLCNNIWWKNMSGMQEKGRGDLRFQYSFWLDVWWLKSCSAHGLAKMEQQYSRPLATPYGRHLWGNALHSVHDKMLLANRFVSLATHCVIDSSWIQYILGMGKVFSFRPSAMNA